MWLEKLLQEVSLCVAESFPHCIHCPQTAQPGHLLWSKGSEWCHVWDILIDMKMHIPKYSWMMSKWDKAETWLRDLGPMTWSHQRIPYPHPGEGKHFLEVALPQPSDLYLFSVRSTALSLNDWFLSRDLNITAFEDWSSKSRNLEYILVICHFEQQQQQKVTAKTKLSLAFG